MPSLYSIVARFAVQVENKTKGLQTYEDRTLMIEADSREAAKQKLLAGFFEYGEPYLNPYGEQVRWQFEAFLDTYEMNYASLEDVLKEAEQGVEVFSSLKQRRLKPEHVWKK